ncbi:MAG TPA: FAD-dependent oxidoreductase [Candidatus Hypogeohydataceae bacterium YC41]
MAYEDIVTIDLKQPIDINLQPRSIIRYKGSFQKLLSERKYKVNVAVDPAWFHKNVPCRGACPVGTNARAYVRAIADGDYQKAYLVARENNPLVSVCGKVCNAPCESACTRGKLDEPVAIRALKEFAVEKNRLRTREVYKWLSQRKGKVTLPEKVKAPRIAIVGAGPAGLSAAHDLTLMGYKVKLFEASSQPGGMLINAIPPFRLAREVVQQDVENILSLGIELEVNASCGKDFSIEELKEKYDATLLATGLQKSQDIDIPGIELRGVYQGLDFLRQAVPTEKISLGTKVVVVGGGNLAVEVARAVRRTGSRDVKVSIVCYEAARGTRPGTPEQEMQADDTEIAEALQEGVIFHPGLGPRRILGEVGKVEGLELAPVIGLNYDKEGRYKPIFGQNSSTFIEADTVFLAMGQEPDLSFMNGVSDLATGTKRLEAGAKFVASKEGIFVCGDLAGTGHIVEAVASGQKAALAIHDYLGGKGSLGLGELRPVVPVHHHEKGDTFTKKLTISRMLPPVTPVSERLKSMEPMEGCYSEKVARRQGDRCLDCTVSPVIGPYHPCNACGDCLDACPTECLSLRFMNKKDLSSADGGVEEVEGEGPWVGLIIDEELCVHCGACAEACWADAIHMVRFKEME